MPTAIWPIAPRFLSAKFVGVHPRLPVYELENGRAKMASQGLIVSLVDLIDFLEAALDHQAAVINGTGSLHGCTPLLSLALYRAQIPATSSSFRQGILPGRMYQICFLEDRRQRSAALVTDVLVRYVACRRREVKPKPCSPVALGSARQFYRYFASSYRRHNSLCEWRVAARREKLSSRDSDLDFVYHGGPVLMQ